MVFSIFAISYGFRIANGKKVAFRINNKSPYTVLDLEICLSTNPEVKTTQDTLLDDSFTTLPLDMSTVINSGKYFINYKINGNQETERFGNYTKGYPSESTVNITIGVDYLPLIDD
ncbi:MAG: hypothetical protein LKE40_14395 [Spirochaetia bacterium]|nr:hypothetical protein [Spirochaetia bacterium]